MKTHLLYIYTRTPLHVGAGGSVGAIDQPVQRERHTRHPIIPGSSIKGVMRYTADQLDKEFGDEAVKDLFGPELIGENREKEARAGDITFGEARPVAFPVRSAKGSFAYITCPLTLRRFARDAGRSDLSDLPELDDQHCLAGPKVILPTKKRVVLEEYAFESDDAFPADWEEALCGLVDDAVWKEARGRLVLLSDGDFSHFVASACEISQHTKIDPKTGTVASGALFNLESVPTETLFCATVTVVGRKGKDGHYASDGEAELRGLLERHPVLQFGGNSTTGRGFCTVKLG
ncbi:MAG: type III-B CRISPR module RAMP protein Cmr4 [Verrucomicrobiales bacterium]